MRDPKRIPKILKRLEAIWKKNPDLRFCQLMGNFSIALANPDSYYIEDNDFIEALEKMFKKKRLMQQLKTDSIIYEQNQRKFRDKILGVRR